MPACVDPSRIHDDVKSVLPQVIALRRAIHKEPELGLHTPLTSAKIMAALADLPLKWRHGPSTTGLVAVLRGAWPGRRVLLRGDMDALPLQEDTGLAFASTVSGAMHACGHDAHAAMLMGAARLLATRRAELAGEIMFMFQPGEEGHHGARFMVEDGLLDPLPDAAFALHIMPTMQLGRIIGRAGPLLASIDDIEIVIHGRGGHASMPHEALDPVPIACELITALQTLVTRSVAVSDPAVITIGKISAGTTTNVIPETATLLGTVRTLSAACRHDIEVGIRRLASHIAAAHGAKAEITVRPGFPVTRCDPEMVAFGARAADTLFGAGTWMPLEHAMMGGEDFSYVLEKVPGAMFYIGANEVDGAPICCGLHSNRMVFDEQAMAIGVAYHVALATEFLLPTA